MSPTLYSTRGMAKTSVSLTIDGWSVTKMEHDNDEFNPRSLNRKLEDIMIIMKDAEPAWDKLSHVILPWGTHDPDNMTERVTARVVTPLLDLYKKKAKAMKDDPKIKKLLGDKPKTSLSMYLRGVIHQFYEIEGRTLA